MRILHNVLYTFPKVLTKRICLTIKIISFILVTVVRDLGVRYCEVTLDASHPQISKDLKYFFASITGENSLQ